MGLTGFGTALEQTATGREILARDWSRFAVGAPAQWPDSLTALVSMILACPTPMFLAWGTELNAFYNDAYVPILGRRAGDAMGKPFRELWGDIWDDIGPLVDATLAGKSQRMVDMQLDLQRQGVPEESWWTFTYSPVRHEDGTVAGLLCVTGETTERVLAERARDAADERLQMALSAGNSIGAWDWDVVTDRVTADARFALLYGIDPERAAEGAPIAEFFAGIHPDDLPRVQREIDTAMRDGGVFASEYRVIGENGGERWVSAQGRCILDETGRCIRFPGVSFDITQRHLADAALRAAKDEREFIVELTRKQRELSDPEAILDVSLESLAAWFGVDRAGFYRQLPNGRVRYGPVWTNGRLPTVLGDIAGDRYGERLRRCRTEGLTLAYADTAQDPVGGLEELAEAGVVSGVCHPLMHGGRFISGVFLHNTFERDWSDRDLALIREVAELALIAVDRAEALVRLEHQVGQQEEALAQQARELREEAAQRAAAEAQLRQLQKMEAVGQLTGGIAHDFNNMLAVVIGGLNLMQRRLDRGETDIQKYVEAAMDGATRAAALTQRLLAFSRQSPLAPEAVDANAMIHGLTELLERTLGEPIALQTRLGADLGKAKADPNQLENVVINLAVNARDAMPYGGRLTIETANAQIDADAFDEEVLSGAYVMIAVTDTGTGMTPEVMEKAFDPFFTTKDVGKGTGLGLSQVFGFVRQSDGHVKIESEVGRGTTVRVYLPRFVGKATEARARTPATRARGGSPDEVILVVEDEERLRNFSVEALRELGYTVVHARDGAEALQMIEAGQGATLLFTDVVMPGMTGRQLADAALARMPGLLVLFTTGYARNAVVHNGTLDPGTNFLTKPFGIDELANKVREVLDGAK